MRRILSLPLLLLDLTLAWVGGHARATRADGACLTREEAISLIAHKADVEYGGALSKWRIWAIADRESGLYHCWPNGRVKISPTGDHGLIQLHPAGVFANCDINPYCREPDLIDDPAVQVDVMINYYRRYGDLCPWNPDQVHPNYMPGCGYR